MKMCVKLILFVALISIMSCKKNTDTPPGSSVVYEETISNIKKNEPVLLTFSNNGNASEVTWVIDPSAGTTINAIGNRATLTFSIPGTYKVTATSGNISANYTITIINSNYTNYGNQFNLSASKQINVNPQEPVVFAVHNAKAGSQIKWTVDNLSTIDTINNTATITFISGGVWMVTASDGVSSKRIAVWVNDDVNANPNLDTIGFMLGEKLQLTPAIATIGGSKQLVISANTVGTYHCPTDKILSFSINNDYVIDYGGVAISTQPCSPAAVASSVNSFSSVAAGDHKFTINFENKTFTGNLNVSNAGVYTFTWPDNSLVNISPLVVQ